MKKLSLYVFLFKNTRTDSPETFCQNLVRDEKKSDFMDVEIKISDLVLSIEIFLCIYILNKIVFFELMANILKSNHLEKKFLYP